MILWVSDQDKRVSQGMYDINIRYSQHICVIIKTQAWDFTMSEEITRQTSTAMANHL